MKRGEDCYGQVGIVVYRGMCIAAQTRSTLFLERSVQVSRSAAYMAEGSDTAKLPVEKETREVSADAILTILLLKDLQGMNESKSTMLRGIAHSAEMKPYIKCIQHHLKRWIPEHSHIDRSLEFASDPGDFVCDPSEIVAYVFDRSFDGSIGGKRLDEAKLDSE